jgi:hypothetical protein
LGTGVLAVVLALGATTAMAKNQWSNYHWESPTDGTQLTINVNDCQTHPGLNYYNTTDSFSGPNTNWDYEITASGGAIAVADGTCPGLTAPSDPIGSLDDGSFDTRAGDYAYDATLVDPVDTGTVNAFNSNYGNSGWVGLAIIALPSGDVHIFYGETYLNDYYPGASASYNQPARMRKVQCQEVGHTLGLTHIKKDESCMYSSRAFFGSVYMPSPHDGEEVNSITDIHGGAVIPPPEDDGGGPCKNNPDHWKCQAERPTFRGQATWAERYESRDDMFEAADVVVSARVLNGSLFDRVVGAPGRGLPVSQAVLQIQETFKGNAKGVIRIEHTRGLGLEIEDDPGYVNGDDYLLFLRQMAARTFRVVNPSGRIQQ